MTDVVLVYPYFNEERDKSIFRYPPLGLGYIASSLRSAGYSVALVDCTFSIMENAMRRIRSLHPRVLGVYSMVTMNHHAIAIAQALKNEVELLVAGGPLPSLVPDTFLDTFDVVVVGEGERTIIDLLNRHFNHQPWQDVPGIAYRAPHNEIAWTTPRPQIENLDDLPFPARDLFPHDHYKWYWNTYHGYTATSMISTRGCPYNCDFCSNPVFGVSYRERSAQNVVDEMVKIHEIGYDRIFFQDDCFTLNPRRTMELCKLLIDNKLDLEWMCLSRADHLGKELASIMARAGCRRVFFGIESGNPRMLKVIGKKIILPDARRAVVAAKLAGMETGAFFILGYPGDNNESLLDTIRFSSSLPLDYLSYSFPYPIPGTGLYERVKNKITVPEWRKQRNKAGRHDLLFQSDFSARKLRFAQFKGYVQHWLRSRGKIGIITSQAFERLTDKVLFQIT
ncbi:MAG TPA: radical SAM protein [Candidatus Lokiarchaeia archaeon]|nr:radical SAM protein [Candidatus Lokiarchaeia archaeon]